MVVEGEPRDQVSCRGQRNKGGFMPVIDHTPGAVGRAGGMVWVSGRKVPDGV